MPYVVKCRVVCNYCAKELPPETMFFCDEACKSAYDSMSDDELKAFHSDDHLERFNEEDDDSIRKKHEPGDPSKNMTMRTFGDGTG